MRWQQKLTKKQLKHCRENGATTLWQIKRNVEHQDAMRFPCWECIEIGRKLSIEVKTTAFDERI